MALAFPGRSGELWEVIARDAFLDALSDSDLRYRVAEKDPSTLEEALRFACRLEALRRPEPTEAYDDLGRRRDRVVRAVEPAANADLEDRTSAGLLKELASEVRRNGERLDRMESVSRHWERSGFYEDVASRGPVRDGPIELPSGGRSGDRNVPTRCMPSQPEETRCHEPPPVRSGPATDSPDPGSTRGSCFYCHRPGHWKRECPYRNRSVFGASSAQSGKETHVEIMIGEHRTLALLDTGSQISLLPKRLLPNVALEPAPSTARAANHTEILVDGIANMTVSVTGIPCKTCFWVSPSIREPILGIDWLTENKCAWFIGEGRLKIGNKDLKLIKSNQQGAVRRVYVSKEVVVDPYTQSVVSVDLSWSSGRPRIGT